MDFLQTFLIFGDGHFGILFGEVKIGGRKSFGEDVLDGIGQHVRGGVAQRVEGGDVVVGMGRRGEHVYGFGRVARTRLVVTFGTMAPSWLA